MAHIEETIKVQLFKGTCHRVIKCTKNNRKSVVYKIPREKIQECVKLSSFEKEFKHSGVYILFGKANDGDQKYSAYIGKTEGRSNINEGILYRLQEHMRVKKWWTDAVALTSEDELYLGPSEVGYLEHRFCDIADKANRFLRNNGNTPTLRKLTEDKRKELEEIVEHFKLIVEILGYNVFIPEPTIPSVLTDGEFFYLAHSKDKEAKVKFIGNDNFSLLAGSYIRPVKNLPTKVMKLRQDFANLIVNDELKTDILITSITTLCSFVLGTPSSDGKRWKRKKDGKTLEEVAKVSKPL